MFVSIDRLQKLGGQYKFEFEQSSFIIPLYIHRLLLVNGNFTPLFVQFTYPVTLFLILFLPY
jgi:hypothetical protein